MAIPAYKSLQWQAAVKSFLSILLAGAIALSVAAYLSLRHTDNVELLVYFSLAASVLVLLALLMAGFSFFSLQRSASQLEQISHVLPLVSAKKYDDVEQVFQQLQQAGKATEVSELFNAIEQLTSVLRRSDDSVSQRSQLLHQANADLRNERDFIKSLLDTAQLIILTINENFEITMLNDHGEKVTGFSEQEMLNSQVARVFPAGNWTEAETRFRELLAGNLQIAQQDAELIDKQGRIKNISWLHSHLGNNNNNARILSVGLDMTEKKEAEKRIVWMAEHDPLTDLCNRRKFTEEFEKSLRTAIRYNHNNTLLYLDLDQFKDINDTSGHTAGDELLKLVAETLKRVTRFTDLVARLGGDEFAILMPESDNDGAQVLARKIISELGQIHLEYGVVKHKISTSIGIVHYPLHDTDIHELLSFADLAMYKAKATGKGSYHTFSPDDNTREQLETRVFWKHQIEEALEHNHFILHYQPILELKSNTIEHYEVLIRMRDPHTGEIRMPGKFIEIAEQIGLIHNIDQYVIRSAITKMAELKQQGINARFAINLSGSVVDAPILLTLLKKLIRKHNINPANLIFEVTETSIVQNLQQAKLMMTAIKALGCQFSLDDFGVGFSSFNYMRELPVDIIKIDGIFIKDLNKNAADQLFVKALVDVARGLGRKTVAEFVENNEVLTLLRTYDVDFAQGYYIGRPKAELADTVDWQPRPETVKIHRGTSITDQQ